MFENSRSQILFRTDIFQKLTLGAPDGSGEKETEPLENLTVEWNVLIPGFEQFDFSFFSADSPAQLSNLISFEVTTYRHFRTR